jgi:hypothetical protein
VSPSARLYSRTMSAFCAAVNAMGISSQICN